MQETISLITKLLATLVVTGDVFIVLALVTILLKKFAPNPLKPFAKHVKNITAFIHNNLLHLALAIVLVATLGSLFYSEIAQYTPCKLCWFQRIFMYPLVLYFGTIIFTKAVVNRVFVLLMAGIGALVAAYHYLLQIKPADLDLLAPCSAIGGFSSCSTTFTMTFGYITIPFMALTAFILVLILFLAFHAREL